MADFQERINTLIRSVGPGYIVARCKVNQPYAQDQHQTDRYRHDDGRSHYLDGPLLEHAFELVESISRGVITPMGSDVHKAMIDVAEEMAGYVLKNAPKETGQLSLSGNPSVQDNDVLIYDRPALAPREVD